MFIYETPDEKEFFLTLKIIKTLEQSLINYLYHPTPEAQQDLIDKAYFINKNHDIGKYFDEIINGTSKFNSRILIEEKHIYLINKLILRSPLPQVSDELILIDGTPINNCLSPNPLLNSRETLKKIFNKLFLMMKKNALGNTHLHIAEKSLPVSLKFTQISLTNAIAKLKTHGLALDREVRTATCLLTENLMSKTEAFFGTICDPEQHIHIDQTTHRRKFMYDFKQEIDSIKYKQEYQPIAKHANKFNSVIQDIILALIPLWGWKRLAEKHRKDNPLMVTSIYKTDTLKLVDNIVKTVGNIPKIKFMR